MARIDGPEVQARLCEVFGQSPKDITPAQVFLLVKIIKHCRLRCRSNAALHNWLKRAFPDLTIGTTKVLSKYPKYAGETYDALTVKNKALPDVGTGTEEEDEAS